MLTLLARAWFWSRIAVVILVAMMLLPPVAGYARQYAFAQALQFVIFAAALPALLALGIPRQVRSPDWPPGLGRDAPAGQARAPRSCWPRSSPPRLPGGCLRRSTRWPGTRPWPSPR